MLLLFLARDLRAQATDLTVGGLDQLLSRLETVNFYYGARQPSRSDAQNPGLAPWKNNVGVEFGLHLTKLGDVETLPWYAAHEVVKARRSEEKDRAEKAKAEGATLDTAEIRLTTHIGNQKDSTIILRPHKGEESIPIFEADIGLGYGQFGGFQLATPYEIHGQVRELPSLSLYLTINPFRYFGFYTGLRTGVLTLQDMQVYVPDTLPGRNNVISGSASTLERGWFPIGVVAHYKGLQASVSLARVIREFNAISYSPTNIPADLPKGLDMSGRSWEFGLKLPVPAGK